MRDAQDAAAAAHDAGFALEAVRGLRCLAQIRAVQADEEGAGEQHDTDERGEDVIADVVEEHVLRPGRVGKAAVELGHGFSSRLAPSKRRRE